MEFRLSSESEVFSYLRSHAPELQERPIRRPANNGFEFRPVSRLVTARPIQLAYDREAVVISRPTRTDASFSTRIERLQISQSSPQALQRQMEHIDQPSAPSLETTECTKPKHSKISRRRAYHYEHRRRLFRLRSLTKTQMALYSAAVLLFVGGLGVSFDGWRANSAVHAQVSQLTKVVATIPKADGGTAPDVTSGNAQTTKSSGGGSTYTVAPDMPRYLKIPSIKVNARVVTVGILKDGSLGTPTPNTNQVGWYSSSSKPGNAGAMVIDGHVSGLNTVGVFYNLKKLNAGDSVQIERGDGQVNSYQVVKVVTYDADKVDMDSLINPVDYSKPGLNLITCAGQYDAKSAEFNQRTVVFTEQI